MIYLPLLSRQIADEESQIVITNDSEKEQAEVFSFFDSFKNFNTRHTVLWHETN